MKDVEMIEDGALDGVVGGLSFSLGLDTDTGLSITSPLGSVNIANPISVAGELLSGVTEKLGDFLVKFGGNLKSLGQIFNFH